MNDLDRLISALSHDLGGYLRKVGGFLELAADGDPEMMQWAQEQSQLSFDWLAQAVAFYRLKPADGEPEPVPLAAAVGAAWEEAKERGADAHDTKAELRIDGDAQAWAHPEQVHRVLVELLHNARRFAGGAIEVHLSSEPVELVVADHGAGFHPDRMEDVFQPFEKQHSRSDHPGAGLGLPTARALAGFDGGTLVGFTERGVGSRFTVRWPSPP